MSGALIRCAVATVALLTAGMAGAECRFPQADLGALVATDDGRGVFATLTGGTAVGGRRVHVAITGCSENARYGLMLGVSAPVRVASGKRSFPLVPFVVAVNGTDLPMAVNLASENILHLQGNPQLDLVFAATPGSIDLAAGTYSGSFMMLFVGQ